MLVPIAISHAPRTRFVLACMLQMNEQSAVNIVIIRVNCSSFSRQIKPTVNCSHSQMRYLCGFLSFFCAAMSSFLQTLQFLSSYSPEIPLSSCRWSLHLQLPQRPVDSTMTSGNPWPAKLPKSAPRPSAKLNLRLDANHESREGIRASNCSMA